MLLTLMCVEVESIWLHIVIRFKQGLANGLNKPEFTITLLSRLMIVLLVLLIELFFL